MVRDVKIGRHLLPSWKRIEGKKDLEASDGAGYQFVNCCGFYHIREQKSVLSEQQPLNDACVIWILQMMKHRAN